MSVTRVCLAAICGGFVFAVVLGAVWAPLLFVMLLAGLSDRESK